MNFAIWSAVSTSAQVKDRDNDDKESLREQVSRSRAAGLAKGWKDTGLTYTVPGKSRTQWVDLRDAEQELPALHDMLEAAKAHKFDILITYDYSRFRDLLDQVAKYLARHGVQIYSVNQPVEPIAPQEFNPYSSDAESMMRGMAQILSRAQVNDLRRRYKFGMPARIARGLPANKPPYGFRKPPGRESDRKAVPVTDPAQASVVVQIKDMFLAGSTLWQIADHLNQHKIPTPRGHGKRGWTDVKVRLILKNRFYCGEVSFGTHRRRVDSDGKVSVALSPPSQVVTAKGQHEPLWNLSTQRQIDDEFRKRGRKHVAVRAHQLTNLLYCGICGARMWVEYPGNQWDKYGRYACSADPHHVRRKNSELLPAFAKQLQKDLQKFKVKAPTVKDKTKAFAAAVADLELRRARLTDAYEGGVLSLTDYSARVSDIDMRLKECRAELADAGNAGQRHADRLATIQGFAKALQKSPDYILKAPPQKVNAQLRSIIEKVIVTPTRVKIEYAL